MQVLNAQLHTTLNSDSPKLLPRVLSRPYVETPLVRSVVLSQQTGANVWLKFEQAQLSGSFKSRGLGWLVYRTIIDHPDQEFHFFCASGGNAGYAVACATQQYNQKCTICLPASTDPIMVARIQQTGAIVVAVGATIAESDAHVKNVLLSSAREAGEMPFYCHPYDLPLVWEGNSSLADELVVQSTNSNFKPDAIVCSIGGGGLYNGIVQGLQRHGWSDVQVVAVETAGCATLNASLDQGIQVQMDSPKTVCSSLATRNVSQQTIEYAKIHPTSSVVVTDRDAVLASAQFAESHKMLVEPACGTALAGLSYLPSHLQHKDKNIVIVVCGGTNITWRKLEDMCAKFDVKCEY